MKRAIAGWVALVLFGAVPRPSVAAESFRLAVDTAKIGELPPGWSMAKTGEGPGGVWAVVEDATAPEGKALAQRSDQGPNPLFCLCIADGTNFRDLDLTVSFKAVAGKLDQGGGPVWRYRDANNYYIARMNPLENNYRVYKVVNGKRTQIGSAEVKIPAGEWRTLRVVHSGNHIRCYLGDQLYLDVKDETFKDAGKVGLWTKADAQTRFAGLAVSSSVFAAESSLRIKILYDNYVFEEACGSDWGFACLVTWLEKTILFDTGGKGHLLLSNFEKMKSSPSDVELVVISHNHTDHTGGLLPFLAKNRNVALFLPASTPESFVEEVEAHASSVSVVTKPVEICKGVFVLGPMGDQIIEQALVLETKKGLVIVTGCSHPGVVAIARKAKEYLGRNIFTVLGGTHLLNHSDEELKRVVDDLKGLGVQKVGATHCSGEKAIVKMKEVFGDGFVRMGVGQVIEVGE